MVLVLVMTSMPSAVLAGTGFDQYGYNDAGRIFNGTCTSWGMGKYGWSEAYAQTYCGIYANDNLVMKWNAEWDRGNAEGWTNGPYEAWTSNQWNGKNGGSGSVWQYKIIWVGVELESSQYWRPGGYAIWGQFEVVMDQGIDPSLGEGHFFYALARPNGYGSY